jgi:hypothetical protein
MPVLQASIPIDPVDPYQNPKRLPVQALVPQPNNSLKFPPPCETTNHDHGFEPEGNPALDRARVVLFAEFNRTTGNPLITLDT